MATSYQKIKGSAEPLNDDILVYDMDTGEKTLSSGIILLDDTNFNGFGETDARNARGVRNRWATIYKIGKNVDYVNVGDKILVEHGRWTHTIDFEDAEGNILKLQKIDPKAILLVEENE